MKSNNQIWAFIPARSGSKSIKNKNIVVLKIFITAFSIVLNWVFNLDENILSAQNLISSNMVVDELLKRKILDKDFNIDELVDEDRQAILIFLRNTAFGSEYTLTTYDPKTDKEFRNLLNKATHLTADGI